MNQVPFAFVDSVAHLVSKESAGNFSHLSARIWSSVGQTHKEKRADYFLRIFVGELSCFKMEDHSHSLFPVEDLWSSHRSYARIREFQLGSLAYTNLKEEHLQVFRQLVSHIPFHKLNAYGRAKKDFWKVPVEVIVVEISTPLEMLAYHLSENHHLKTLEVRSATVNFLITLFELFEKEKIQKADVTRAKTGTEKLIKLGFIKNTNGIKVIYERDMHGKQHGKPKTIRICCV